MVSVDGGRIIFFNVGVEAGGENGNLPTDATIFKYLDWQSSLLRLYNDGGARSTVPAFFWSFFGCLLRHCSELLHSNSFSHYQV